MNFVVIKFFFFKKKNLIRVNLTFIVQKKPNYN